VAPADAGALAGTLKAQDVANTLSVSAKICVASTKSTKSERDSAFFSNMPLERYTQGSPGPLLNQRQLHKKVTETHNYV
jgi:hypothetical protein